ncbi:MULTISPECIES: threonine/serine dehydratase [Rhizorhabdus]|uniref:threonine/serine dehydratase n=1 Tax=Rhizorhabdus TaxID=1649486 RepID=UPI0021F850DB|nr:threonine/serine dehydratase [Rhizorhabdus wittichii]
MPGAEVMLKLELFQHGGSFKARGALLNLLRLDEAQRARGVTAVSAGNHAIAVAFAAHTLGVDAKVVMASTANPARIAAARAYGAEVILSGDAAQSFARAEQIARDEGRFLVHPFDGETTALGTATLGLEIAEQMGRLDAIIVPIGGGGLAGGVASAIRALQPGCRIHGVEPAGADAMSRSFAAGAPVRLEKTATIADSLAPPMALPYSYALCRSAVDAIVRIDDDAICHAGALLFREMKLAVEPAGAAATAALVGPLSAELRDARTAVIICGANIDIEDFKQMVQQGQAVPSRSA